MHKSIIEIAIGTFLRTFPLGLIFTLGTFGSASLPPFSGVSSLPIQSGSETIRSEVPADASSQESKTDLSNFAWLAGDWEGTWGPRIVEQKWLAPKAGQMAGIYRVLENTKTLVVELFSLIETPGAIEFRLRHFTPELTPWEKDGPASLKLASIDPKSAVFENSAAGQPKRATFIRVDLNTYISRSEIVAEDGSIQVTEIAFHRQNTANPSTASKKGPKAKR